MENVEKVKRIKLKDRTPENDINYRGYLYYRHLRIIGWACMLIAQLGIVFSLAAKLSKGFAADTEALRTVLGFFASLPVPLFLLANFSFIFRSKKNYRSLFILYGGGALGMYILCNFLVFHFGFRFIDAFYPTDWWKTSLVFGAILPQLGTTGYCLNMFIDMLLCTLLFFFMNYKPEKVFVGKKLIIFRLFVILPIVYEVSALIIKYCIGISLFSIPSFVFFLLPNKPPLIFLAFVCIVFALKIGEVKFLKRHNGDEAAYEEHCQTNAHSFKVSILISIIFLIMAFLDLILVILVLIRSIVSALEEATTEEELELIAFMKIDSWLNAGIGGAVVLFLIIPVVLLFSYTKTHKNPKLDKFIPMIGIGLIVLMYIEGLFQIVVHQGANLIEKIQEWISGGGEEEGAEGGEAVKEISSHLIANIKHITESMRSK